MTRWATFFLAAAFTLPLSQASVAHHTRLRPGLEARGCYFSRGHVFCGRYCYTEIDGVRYCRDRVHEAYSQAPEELELVGPVGHRSARRRLK